MTITSPGAAPLPTGVRSSSLRPRRPSDGTSTLGGPAHQPRPCHVLDAKYEPGIRASVLYQHGADLVRGDLLAPDSRRPEQRVVTGWPGMELSVYPDDPDLPTLPLASQPP